MKFILLTQSFVKNKKFLLVLFALMSSGCSVYKAASNEGIAPMDIKTCKYKSALLAKGMERIDTKELSDGRVLETYRAIARKSGANYLRAAGHGVLDVMTLGVWEVVGTPVEGAISNNRHYVIAKATYANKSQDEIQQLEIYDPSGKKVQ